MAAPEKTKVLLSILVFLSAGCSGALPPEGTPQTGRLAAETRAELTDSISELSIDLFEKWGALEPDAFLSRFSEDFEFYIEGSRVTRPAFDGMVRGAMADLRQQGWDAEITSGPNVHVLGRAAAVSSFLYSVYQEDETAVVDTLQWGWTIAWERRGAAWEIVQSHESMASPAPDGDPNEMASLQYVSGVVFPPGVPFSEAVRIGDVLFLSGAIGTKPNTERAGTAELVPGGIKPEARQAMEHIRTYLKAGGSSMDRIARCTVFLVDLNEWAAFNEVYMSFFEPPYPARSAVGVKELVLDARVEIECIAAAGGGSTGGS